MTTPAEPGYQIYVLMRKVEELQTQLNDAIRTRGVSFERAQVTSVGGSQVTVTYPGGATRPLPYLGTAPAALDQVLIINAPAWSGVVGKTSA